MLSATSTDWAPWYVIPADRKWFARICAAAVLAHTLIELDPQYPTVSPNARQALLTAKGELEAEAPEGAAADPYEAAMPQPRKVPAARPETRTSAADRERATRPQKRAEGEGDTGLADWAGPIRNRRREDGGASRLFRAAGHGKPGVVCTFAG
jgi:hypothetical protein